MQTAKAERRAGPAVIEQFNLFGGCDVITINKPGKKPKPDSEPVEHTAPKIEIIVPPVRKSVSPSRKTIPVEDDFPLPGQRFDDGVTIDLEAVSPDDDPETLLAKRMFLRMLWDITPKRAVAAKLDLLGQATATNQDEQDRLDALIWMYSLNPDGSLVPFEWVCDVLGFDVHRVRRITGRTMGADLKRIVNLLSTIIDECHAQLCEERLSDYLDVSNWASQ
jgi:hypothetical protein